MSKLKIERGASKLRWVLLKTNIEEPIAVDLDLMCKWSDNDRKYVVNELLRFALSQSGDFQKHKSEQQTASSGTANGTRFDTFRSQPTLSYVNSSVSAEPIWCAG